MANPHAVTTNEGLLAAWDADETVTLVRSSYEGSAAAHAAAWATMESLRVLLASGMTVEEYNNMSSEAWEAHKAAVVAATGLDLGQERNEEAANLGGNYFEQGYQAFLAAAGTLNQVQKNKPGTVP